MTSRFQCPSCGARLSYQGQPGDKIKPCPKCRMPIALANLAELARLERGY